VARYLALRDRRLEGGVPARPAMVIVNTDEHTSLTAAFRAIASAARGGKIDTMFILCHGFAGENTSAGVSIDAGGMGLELGRQ
jgi:homoaconitase/3-isopropylmalate dehydratase large subunit